MVLGIVGSEAAKFTPETECDARALILSLFDMYQPEIVVSGECHLGGVDIFAHEEADLANIAFLPLPPVQHTWERGYKLRNMQIAESSDVTVCITVRELPAEYTGRQFPYCYHCGTRDHIKSGGCWTTKYARGLGKDGYTLVVG